MPATASRAALLRHGGDGQFRRLIHDLLRLNELMTGARRHLAAALSLSPAQYTLLMIVAEGQGSEGMAVAEAAARQHVSGAFVTTQANRLVEAGLVEKRPNPADGRSVLIRLTAKAEAELRRASPTIRAFNDAFFANLEPAAFDELCATVTDLIASGELALLTAAAQRDDLAPTVRRAIAGLGKGRRR